RLRLRLVPGFGRRLGLAVLALALALAHGDVVPLTGARPADGPRPADRPRPGGRRAERGQAVGRLVVVEVSLADPGQEAGVVVLPERPVRPRGRHGGPRPAVRGQPERVMPEPAGGAGALPPPGGRRVDDRPLPGQRDGPP